MLHRLPLQRMQMDIIQTAKQTIAVEATAIASLTHFINTDFEKVVNLIANGKGRLVVSGIGKSAIVAQKMVATFNSTGTPALFMHAGDAIHGDLGMIQPNDIVLILSKSGESPEIKAIVPLIKKFENTLIAMVGNTNSYLAQQATIIINTTINKEACPNNLAPTTSTTAQMVMGDAIAVCLMEMKGFNDADFAKYHPGGNLGKRLYLRVSDLITINLAPKVLPTASLKEVIIEITEKRLGVTAVVNDTNNIIGIITDGDLRRMLEQNSHFEHITAADILSKNPKTIAPFTMAVDALEVFALHDISQLLVAENGSYLGVLHLHDLIKEGIM